MSNISDGLTHLATPITDLLPLEGNPRKGDVSKIAASLRRFGQRKPIVARKLDGGGARGEIIAGNHTYLAAQSLGWDDIAVVFVDDDKWTARAFAIADNRTAEVGHFDDDLLAAMLSDLASDDELLADSGWSTDEVAELLARVSHDDPIDGGGSPDRDDNTPATGTLSQRFLLPPLSVLDQRSGYWQSRKRAWLSLGIRSEEGRDGHLTFSSQQAMANMMKHRKGGLALTQLGATVPDYYKQKEEAEAKAGRTLTNREFEAEYLTTPATGTLSTTGTSVFDPVLTEVAYTWFSPTGAAILDPFAGGSVRGVVAAYLDRHYTGVDLRAEQVAANREQLHRIIPPPPDGDTDDATALTPVTKVDGIWVKRDDTYRVGDSRGGKVRACRQIIEDALTEGPIQGLITAGSRQSPQVNIVATLARQYGLPCRVHVPTGDLTPELSAATVAGAELVQHHPGYNNVLIARARDDAAESGWLEVPFGMEHPATIAATAAQTTNIPKGVKRIIVPVGSGMALAGILTGLSTRKTKIPVIGIQVGADPTERLDRYAPPDWRDRVTLTPSGSDYHTPATTTRLGDIDLDPIYEAKCIPHLQPGDLLWVVGRRATATPTGTATWITGDSTALTAHLPTGYKADLIFSCPPYHDLEQYSDDPADLSNMPYRQFLTAYRDIIKQSIDHLNDNRFAVWVIGDVRDKAGHYRNLIGDTIQAFTDAGAHYYNEAILVSPVGSLPIRVGLYFTKGRKLGKTHQQILVFVKGDPRKATEYCGDVQVADIPDTGDSPT